MSLARKIAACRALFDSPIQGEADAAKAAYARLIEGASDAEIAGDGEPIDDETTLTPNELFRRAMTKAKAAEAARETPSLSLEQFLLDEGYWLKAPLMIDQRYEIYGTDPAPLAVCDLAAIKRFAQALGYIG
jgi:hypothetical protein